MLGAVLHSINTRLDAAIIAFQLDHAMSKVVIVDREFISVGSTNFDMRSLQLNDEASLNIYDKAFAEQLTKIFEADLDPTVEYTYSMWKQRPLRQRVAENILLPIKSHL